MVAAELATTAAGATFSDALPATQCTNSRGSQPTGKWSCSAHLHRTFRLGALLDCRGHYVVAYVDLLRRCCFAVQGARPTTRRLQPSVQAGVLPPPALALMLAVLQGPLVQVGALAVRERAGALGGAVGVATVARGAVARAVVLRTTEAEARDKLLDACQSMRCVWK